MPEASRMTDDPGPADGPRPADAAARRRRRVIAAGLLILTIAAGLGVHALAADGSASDIAGDALYAIAAYLAVVIVLPRVRTPFAVLIAAAWCTCIELFQLTGVPVRIGADFSPAMLVLGTVFDVRDLVVYIVTIAITGLVDGALRGRRRVSI